MNPVHYSSRKHDWETPAGLFDELDLEFGFDTDVCATGKNSKCDHYFSKDEDGLAQGWAGLRCWCNPPYGREISKWVQKAAGSNALVVMLLPARTDTRWFHDHIYGKAEVRFLKGRLRFVGARHPAPFPSMVVVFRPKPRPKPMPWAHKFPREDIDGYFKCPHCKKWVLPMDVCPECGKEMKGD
jgi:site-specific DNA-methyltransferase (adenine-specific)